MNTSGTKKLGLGWILLAVVLVTACSSPDESAESMVASENYDTTLNVQEIMNLVLEPASDILWDSGGWIVDASGYEELYPTTDDGWEYVRAQAAVVVESGNMLALPDRAEDNDAWIIYSKGLSSAGLMAMEAAAAQNEEDFFQAGAQLYSVCTRPTIPKLTTASTIAKQTNCDGYTYNLTTASYIHFHDRVSDAVCSKRVRTHDRRV